jgi:hypothetical protein
MTGMAPGEDAMSHLRRLVVVLLLAVWSFPATALARGETEGNQTQSGRAASFAPGLRGGVAATASESQQYSQREQQSQDLEQFSGGSAIYIGGGAVTVLLLVIIIILLV